jgi:hypothetical protein
VPPGRIAAAKPPDVFRSGEEFRVGSTPAITEPTITLALPTMLETRTMRQRCRWDYSTALRGRISGTPGKRLERTACPALTRRLVVSTSWRIDGGCDLVLEFGLAGDSTGRNCAPLWRRETGNG